VGSNWASLSVAELEAQGVLLVQDGNHGADRPRPDEFSPAERVAFIRASDLHDGVVDFENADRINATALQRIRKGIGRPGDVIFSSKGTVGKLALTPLSAPPFVCSPQTTFWRSLDSEIVDPHFLFYFMSSDLFRRQWSSRKGETDMADYTSLTAQRRFRIALPDIEEQRAIARLLSPIDDRIRCNILLTDLVEAIASTLFRAWFVERDSLPPIIAPIEPLSGGPGEEWSTEGLDEIADYDNGLAMQKYPPNGGPTLPVVKISELRQGSTFGADLASAVVPPKSIIHDGDLVFSWSGTLMARIWCGGDAALNQHLFKVTSSRFPQWFYYFWTMEHLPEFKAIADDKRTTMGHIKRHHLTDAKVNVAPSAVMEAADRILRPMLERILNSQLHTARLHSLRASLLRPLLDGELSLAGAQALVGTGAT